MVLLAAPQPRFRPGLVSWLVPTAYGGMLAVFIGIRRQKRGKRSRNLAITAIHCHQSVMLCLEPAWFRARGSIYPPFTKVINRQRGATDILDCVDAGAVKLAIKPADVSAEVWPCCHQRKNLHTVDTKYRFQTTADSCVVLCYSIAQGRGYRDI